MAASLAPPYLLIFTEKQYWDFVNSQEVNGVLGERLKPLTFLPLSPRGSRMGKI
jgi:hypothetical protein